MRMLQFSSEILILDVPEWLRQQILLQFSSEIFWVNSLLDSRDCDGTLTFNSSLRSSQHFCYDADMILEFLQFSFEILPGWGWFTPP
jgi:hypothetical protein